MRRPTVCLFGELLGVLMARVEAMAPRLALVARWGPCLGKQRAMIGVYHLMLKKT